MMTKEEILTRFKENGYKVKEGYENYYREPAMVISKPINEHDDHEIIIKLKSQTVESYDDFYMQPYPMNAFELGLVLELFIALGFIGILGDI